MIEYRQGKFRVRGSRKKKERHKPAKSPEEVTPVTLARGSEIHVT